MKHKLIILFFFLAAFSLNLNAQQENKYEFHGVLEENDYPIEGCYVRVYEDQMLVDYTKTLKNGYYKVFLDYNRNYAIEFSKKGFKTRQYSISTNLENNSNEKRMISDLFTISMNKSLNESENPDIEKYYKISSTTGKLVETAGISNTNTNTSESEAILLEARNILAKARIKADSIISAAYRQKSLTDKQTVMLACKSDSIEAAFEQKLFNKNYKSDTIYENISGDIKKKIEEKSQKITEILSKKNLNIEDSLAALENMVSLKEMLINEIEKKLEDAKNQNDFLLVAKMEKALLEHKSELILMKKKEAQFKKQIEQRDKEIRQKNQQLIQIIGIAALLLLLLIIVYFYYVNKKKSSKILMQKNKLLNKQKQEISEANVNLTLQKEKIERQHFQINSSIAYAGTIQNAILPIDSEISSNFEWFKIYKPRDIVSGDFYWYEDISKYIKEPNIKESYLFAVVDCTGHGVPGAFMSMIGSSLLNEIVKEKKILSPAEILLNLDLGIINSLQQQKTKNNDGMDLCMCRIDRLENGQIKLIFSGAKRPLMYFIHESPNIKTLSGARRSIGGWSRAKSKKAIEFKNQEIMLKKGDYVYLSTDGFTDQNNSKRKRFGTPRLIKFFKMITVKPIDKQKEILEKELQEYMGIEEQRDDITVIGLKM